MFCLAVLNCNNNLQKCECSKDTILKLIKETPELKGPPGPRGMIGANGDPGAAGLNVSSDCLLNLLVNKTWTGDMDYLKNRDQLPTEMSFLTNDLTDISQGK